MPSRGRANKAPAPREALRPKKQPTPEENREKLAVERVNKFTRQLVDKQKSYDAEADEVMAQVYGPNWRHRDDIPW